MALPELLGKAAHTPYQLDSWEWWAAWWGLALAWVLVRVLGNRGKEKR